MTMLKWISTITLILSCGKQSRKAVRSCAFGAIATALILAQTGCVILYGDVEKQTVASLANSIVTGATCANAGTGLVQANSRTLSPNGTTVSQYYPGPQTAGNLNILIVDWVGTTGTSTVSDTSGNTYVDIFGGPITNGFESMQYFYASNIIANTAGGNQVTATSTVAADLQLYVLEYSGIQKVSPLDVHAQNTYSSAPTVNSGPITTTNSCDLIVSMASYGTGWAGGMNAGASFDFSANEDAVMSMNVSSAGAYTMTSNQSSGDYATALAAAFKRDTSNLPFKGPIVQSSTYLVNSNTYDPVIMPFNQTAGHLNVVVIAYDDASATVATMTDTLGNTYAKALGPIAYAGMSIYVYYAPITIGGSNTVTPTLTGSGVNYLNVGVFEVSGLTNILTGAAGNSGSGTTATTGSITLPANEQFVMEIVASDSAATPLLDSNFSFMLSINISDDVLGGSRWISTAGNYSATSPLSSSANWVAGIVAFK